MEGAGARAEKGYESYAWLLLVALGVAFIALGIQGVIQGFSSAGGVYALPSSAPPIAFSNENNLFREIALFTLFLGLLALVVGWTGYRRGEKWAWWISFWFFVFVLADDLLSWTIIGIPIGGPPGAVATVLLVLALFLPYRKFFPKPVA